MNKTITQDNLQLDRATMTIRIDKALQEEYNQLSEKTNRSRNELINMALQYALDHMELAEGE